VVVNLRKTPLRGVSVSSPESVMPAGEYKLASLLGGQSGARLQVNEAGRIDGFIPVPTLAGMRAYVFDLAPRTR